MEKYTNQEETAATRSVGPFSLAGDFVTDGWAFVRNTITIRFEAEADFKRLVEHFSSAGCVPCSMKIWKQRTHQYIRQHAAHLLSSPRASQCCISPRRIEKIKSHAHQQCEEFYVKLENEIHYDRWHRAVDAALEPLPQEVKEKVISQLHESDSSESSGISDEEA